MWKDRVGTTVERVGTPRRWHNFRLSLDQSRIALDLRIQGGYDVGVFDVQSGGTVRWTTARRGNVVPVFSPDGNQLAFTSTREGRFNPYVSGAPDGERLVANVGTTGVYPVDWSPDGRYLLYWGDEDLWIVPVDGAEEPYRDAESAYEERDAAFSPDGRWIAYTSNVSGSYEVYVQAFPERVRVPPRCRARAGPAPPGGVMEGSCSTWRVTRA